MSSALVAKLDELLDLVQALEAAPAKLSAGQISRFVELNKDLLEGYDLVAGNAEAARPLDRRLDHYLGGPEVGATPLRQVLLQLHATEFFYTAGGTLGCDSAYNHAVENRDRNARQDGDYFRKIGALKLLDPINTAVPGRLRLEILAAIGRCEIRWDAPPIIENEMDDATIFKIPRAEFILGIVRRWEESGRQILVAQPHAVENRLLEHLRKMADEDPIVKEMLGPRGLRYLAKPSFWIRVKRALSRFADWIGEVFRYLPDALRVQRSRLYAMMGVVVLALALAFAIYVWRDMKRMSDDLEKLEGKVGRVAPWVS